MANKQTPKLLADKLLAQYLRAVRRFERQQERYDAQLRNLDRLKSGLNTLYHEKTDLRRSLQSARRRAGLEPYEEEPENNDG